MFFCSSLVMIRDTYVPFPEDGVPHIKLPEVPEDGRVIVVGGGCVKKTQLIQ